MVFPRDLLTLEVGVILFISEHCPDGSSQQILWHRKHQALNCRQVLRYYDWEQSNIAGNRQQVSVQTPGSACPQIAIHSQGGAFIGNHPCKHASSKKDETTALLSEVQLLRKYTSFALKHPQSLGKARGKPCHIEVNAKIPFVCSRAWRENASKL